MCLTSTGIVSVAVLHAGGVAFPAFWPCLPGSRILCNLLLAIVTPCQGFRPIHSRRHRSIVCVQSSCQGGKQGIDDCTGYVEWECSGRTIGPSEKSQDVACNLDGVRCSARLSGVGAYLGGQRLTGRVQLHLRHQLCGVLSAPGQETDDAREGLSQIS